MGRKPIITTKLNAAYNTLRVVAQADRWKILQMINQEDSRLVDLEGGIPVSNSNLHIHINELLSIQLISKRVVSHKEVWYSINHRKMAMIMVAISILDLNYEGVTLLE